jgi:L-serine dehydratase
MDNGSLPSILNDVIGPVMRGPSSSHTAASWRIGLTGVQLLNEELENAVIEIEKGGIWASNYREQGTVMGMDGGLLGIPITDERIINPGIQASARNISIEYKISHFKTQHPNTLRITLRGKSGKQLTLMAVSTGGGMFEIYSLDGHPVELKGDSYDLFVRCRQNAGENFLDSITGQFFSGYQTIRSAKPGETLVQLKSPNPFTKDIHKQLIGLEGIKEVILTVPVLPVLSGKETGFPFRDYPSMMEFASKQNYTLGELGLMYECSRSGMTGKQLKKQMKEIIGVIETSIDKGLEGTRYQDRILHQQAYRVDEAVREGKIRTDPMVNRLISYITAIMEAKSGMEVIVAVPTAGSCGTFGGTVKAFCDSNGLDEDNRVKAYFAGGLIGVFFAMGPGFAAEEHGCQVETGAAGCMAAAALVELSGGSYQQAVAASSMTLQNCIGLICDPVADRVEVPCLGKNVTAGMNALSASTMALSGFDPVIPLDQVIHTVERVGNALPAALCNSGKGGLAVTQRARELKKRLKD